MDLTKLPVPSIIGLSLSKPMACGMPGNLLTLVQATYFSKMLKHFLSNGNL